MSEIPKLGEFDGKPIVSTNVAITRAGDGLSEAMKTEPRVLHLGEKVYIVIEAEVMKVRFSPLRDDEGLLSRTHILAAGTAAFIDVDVVREVLDTQRERLLLAKEAAAGIQRLPLPEDLSNEHKLGGHEDAPMPGCPDCIPAVHGDDAPESIAPDPEPVEPDATVTSIEAKKATKPKAEKTVTPNPKPSQRKRPAPAAKGTEAG